MDWSPYMSGLFALSGALFGVIGTVFSQIITQRNENIRHARKLAYDAGLAEWRRLFDLKFNDASGMKSGVLSPLEDFVLMHVIFAKIIDKAGRPMSLDTLTSLIDEHSRISAVLSGHRTKGLQHMKK